MPGESFPAARRNRGPIADVLTGELPARGVALEIASGTGEHALYFAGRFPALTWQPSETSQRGLSSIEAWVDESGLDNLRRPVVLDVLEPWPVSRADVVVCINLIHITPWACGQALLAGAGALLPDHGLLYLYGPYKIDGAFTTPSNAEFDASLRARDPRWGLRDVAAVAREAGTHGLELARTVSMPANNLSLIFRRRRQP